MNLKKIFKDFSNVVIIIDDDHNFDYLNRLGINLLGYNETEISDMHFIELLTPDSLECFISNIGSLRETGFCQPFIIDMLKKNGEILPLELSGVRLDDERILLLGRNLSLERGRKEKLEYLEEFNKNILNSIGEGIVVLDLQGKILKYNDFMEKNFQWKKTKVIGKNVFTLFPDYKDQGLLEEFVSIVDNGSYAKKSHIVRQRPDGTRFILNMRGYPLKKGRKISGVVVIVDDITKREEIERQIRKTTELREKVHQIIESIIPLKTISQILDKISLGLNKILGYERGAIFLSEIDKKTLTLKTLFSSVNTSSEINVAKERIEKGITKGKGITVSVFRSGQAKIVKDTDKEKDILRIFADTKSEMIVPIKIKEESIGVITIASRVKNGFDEIDLKFVEMLTNSVAITIGKTKFYEDLLNKLQYLSILYETSQILQGIRKGQIKYSKILKHLSQIFTDFIILIQRFNDIKSNDIIASLNANAEIKKLFSEMSTRSKGRIMEETKGGNPFIVDDTKREKSPLFRKLFEKDIRTLYIFPFFFKDEIIGCLILLSYKPSALGKDQISFLTAIANQLSSSILQLNLSKK